MEEYSWGTASLNDVPDLFVKQVEFVRKNDIMFRLKQGPAFLGAPCPSMTTECTRIR